MAHVTLYDFIDLNRDELIGRCRAKVATAITAFEVLQTGTVGVSSRTAELVHRSLLSMRALLDRPIATVADPDSV